MWLERGREHSGDAKPIPGAVHVTWKIRHSLVQLGKPDITGTWMDKALRHVFGLLAHEKAPDFAMKSGAYLGCGGRI